MIRVFYFSATGNSREAARYLGKRLDACVYEIEAGVTAAETAVVVFPVYCQNVPEPVKRFLRILDARYVALVATYGGMGFGNVLYEAAKLVRGTVIAGACVPMAHSYLKETVPLDTAKLQPLLDRIRSPEPAQIPAAGKVWYADLTPALRSRLGVALRRTESCSACGACDARCPMGTMKQAKPGANCIRCLRCVRECPSQALEAEPGPVLRWYLRKKRRTDYVMYL